MIQHPFLQKHLILTLLTLFQFSAFAITSPSQILPEEYKSLQSTIDSGPGYTVNFTDVSVIEYIKFLSKIADLNFIFNEEDLTFTITIVSEEPTALSNLISALVQVLRINGLTLLEDGSNLLIHKNDTIKQIAPIISQEHPFQGTSIPVLITRVYKINNGNPTNIARVLKPMLSTTSLVEVSEDTRHLIISDTMANIDMISSLLLSLDSPQTSLDIDVYTAKNSSVTPLLPLVTQIITPIAEGNPVILVPQESTNTMFIISTPLLIEKTLTILEDLDAPPVQIGAKKQPSLSGENILFYQIKHKSSNAIATALRQIENNLDQAGFTTSGLTATISSIRYIKASHTMLFTGDPQSLQEVQKLLATIDTPITVEQQLSQSQILIYKIENISEKQLTVNLEKLVQSLDPEDSSNEELIQTITTRQYLTDSNSFIFRGSQATIDRLKTILQHLAPIPLEPVKETFFLYKLKSVLGEVILDDLSKMITNLKASDMNPQLVATLQNIKWIQSTNSLYITGSGTSIEEARALISEFDIGRVEENHIDKSSIIFIYKPKHSTPQELIAMLSNLFRELQSSKLANPALLYTISSPHVIQSSESVLFTGTQESITGLQALLGSIDVPSKNFGLLKQVGETSFFIYKVKFVKGPILMHSLRELIGDLKRSDKPDDPLIATLYNIRYVQDTNSIVFTGTPEVLEKVQGLLEKFDSSDLATPLIAAPRTAPSGYLLYEPKYVTGPALISLMKDFEENLMSSDVDDKNLFDVINHLQWMEKSASILVSGEAISTKKIEELLVKFDVPEKDPLKHRGKTTFFIYKVKFVKSPILMHSLREVIGDLKRSDKPDGPLIETLDNIRYVQDTNSIVFTGTPEVLEKVQGLLEKFDSPDLAAPLVATPRITPSGYLLYEPKYVTGPALISLMKDFEENLMNSGVDDKDLFDVINHLQWMDKSASILVSGEEVSTKKIEELLVKFDVPGKDPSTFIYKVKYVKGPVLMHSLREIIGDLKESEKPDEPLIATLYNIRYVSDTNSIVFTGTPEVLATVQGLLEKFDSPDLAPPLVTAPRITPSGYLLYEPKYVTGPKLISLMKDFEENLMNSGVDDKDLFDVINHLQWMEKSTSILVSGEEVSTQKIENLLVKFDVPEKEPSHKPSIETFHDTSFLIYKLQYHKGSEIEAALQKIGTEISKTQNSIKDTTLVSAIRATQWLEVTNSIISSGDPATLNKLNDLIKSIDIPLKQVFIEILVIETTLSNSLEFGLRWGSQGKYKDRFSFGTGSFPSYPDTRGADPLGKFNSNLASINPPTVNPTGQMIPFGVSGFDLGIIGDLILHKGKTHAALGSFIHALRVDGDSTIVLNQKLITQDNKNSTLFVGSNLPFTGSTTTTTGVNTATTTNLEYRDIGVNLSITPTVGDDDIVTLLIDQKISEVTNNPNNTGNVSGGVNGIATTKSSTSTTVTLPNKHFVAISGMMRNTTTHAKQGIPCLGGLPIVGALFSQNDRLKSTANVLVFIRPHIINTSQEYTELTVKQEELYRSQSEPENFDAGLELVKTPDDE